MIEIRKPEYLSYSAVSQFFKDRDEYFMRYLAVDRPPRAPQGKPASVGSAFDAEVKAILYDRYYGKNYMPEKYSRDALFEKQVEPPQRDYAGPAGKHVCNAYVESGMFDRFVEVFDKAIEPPQFEFRVKEEIGGVPLLGLPDGHAILPDVEVIADWKVNGYCSKSNTSPNKGYMHCLDGYVAKKQSASNQKSHKDHTPLTFKGVPICEQYMEDYSEQWASQLTGYGWCLGSKVGSENVIHMVHQCVAKPLHDGRGPLLRFAEFRGRTRKPFQEMLLRKYQRCWESIESGHIYYELSREESDERCERIASRASAVANDTSEHADFFNNVIRPDWRGN